MAEFDYKEYARQMRENAVKDHNGNIICSSELWEQIASIIENTPASDVVEVKHGYWIVVGRTEHGKSILKCSHCGRARKNHGKSSFCCDCGAKMDGGNAE